ncbi:MAG: hypothetical protein M1826_006745 [Phylliscum demangeonii]|nr:MAG: hypothetical protein M1826_006745 [Phylliscum demangeonii]
MASTQLPIASAVILPEEAPSPPSPPKRRRSSVSPSGNKRRRVSSGDHDGQSEQPQDGGPPEEANKPRALDRHSERRSNGQAEEKQRGRRMFGALLGTLSQNSATTVQKRRADIERKQQSKLKLQAEEYDTKKKKELEQRRLVRKREQKKYDEQSMRIRHSNMLAMAHSLRTLAQPQLYYKPWKLFSEEEARIRKQIEDAEIQVDDELREFDDGRRLHEEVSQDQARGAGQPGAAATVENDDRGNGFYSPKRDNGPGGLEGDEAAGDHAVREPNPGDHQQSSHHQDREHRTDGDVSATDQHTLPHANPAADDGSDLVDQGGESGSPVETTKIGDGGNAEGDTVHKGDGGDADGDADGGEVMVEADEDTVIY